METGPLVGRGASPFVLLYRCGCHSKTVQSGRQPVVLKGLNIQCSPRKVIVYSVPP